MPKDVAKYQYTVKAKKPRNTMDFELTEFKEAQMLVPKCFSKKKEAKFANPTAAYVSSFIEAILNGGQPTVVVTDFLQRHVFQIKNNQPIKDIVQALKKQREDWLNEFHTELEAQLIVKSTQLEIYLEKAKTVPETYKKEILTWQKQLQYINNASSKTPTVLTWEDFINAGDFKPAKEYILNLLKNSESELQAVTHEEITLFLKTSPADRKYLSTLSQYKRAVILSAETFLRGQYHKDFDTLSVDDWQHAIDYVIEEDAVLWQWMERKNSDESLQYPFVIYGSNLNPSMEFLINHFNSKQEQENKEQFFKHAWLEVSEKKIVNEMKIPPISPKDLDLTNGSSNLNSNKQISNWNNSDADNSKEFDNQSSGNILEFPGSPPSSPPISINSYPGTLFNGKGNDTTHKRKAAQSVSPPSEVNSKPIHSPQEINQAAEEAEKFFSQLEKVVATLRELKYTSQYATRTGLDMRIQLQISTDFEKAMKLYEDLLTQKSQQSPTLKITN